MQKLFLSTRPKTGFVFHILQRLSKDQPLLRMKIYVFCIPYEKYRGPGRRPMPGQYEENMLYHFSNHLSSDLYLDYKLK